MKKQTKAKKKPEAPPKRQRRPNKSEYEKLLVVIDKNLNRLENEGVNYSPSSKYTLTRFASFVIMDYLRKDGRFTEGDKLKAGYSDLFFNKEKLDLLS